MNLVLPFGRYVEKKEITEETAKILIGKFEIDSSNYQFVNQNEILVMIAKNLISRHWQIGLRTLDSIQLASALIIKDDIDIFFTSDKVLFDVAINEGLNVKG